MQTSRLLLLLAREHSRDIRAEKKKPMPSQVEGEMMLAASPPQNQHRAKKQTRSAMNKVIIHPHSMIFSYFYAYPWQVECATNYGIVAC
jgi:hypothetical protein